MIDSYGDPVFSRIDWSVNGIKGDGTPLSASGSQRRSTGATLLVEAEIGGYDAYYFDIPHGIGQGSYTIVLHLYKNEDDGAATKRITIRSGV